MKLLPGAPGHGHGRAKPWPWRPHSYAPSATGPPRLPLRGFSYRFVMVGLCFLCTLICYMERVGFSIAYTAVAISLNVDQATKGWVLSAFYYGYAASQIPGGWAAARFGSRRMLLLAFILWSLASLATPARAEPLSRIICARLLVGLSQGAIFPAIHTALAQWIPPHERSRAVSLTTSGMYLGAAVGMAALPGLAAGPRGPRAVFDSMGALGLSWAALWYLLAIDAPGSTAPGLPLAADAPSTPQSHIGLPIATPESLSRADTSVQDDSWTRPDPLAWATKDPVSTSAFIHVMSPSASLVTSSTSGHLASSTTSDATPSATSDGPFSHPQFLQPLPGADSREPLVFHGVGRVGGVPDTGRVGRAMEEAGRVGRTVEEAGLMVSQEGLEMKALSSISLEDGGEGRSRRRAGLMLGGEGASLEGDWAALGGGPGREEVRFGGGGRGQLEEVKSRRHVPGSIPWAGLVWSAPVWAIVVNNFTFHYALYVLMNWLPTYFEQGLRAGASMHSMGASKTLPYLLMFLASNLGGFVADYLIVRRILTTGATRKVLNTIGFALSAVALLLMPMFHTVAGAIACSSTALGSCAFARAGFAVNHMDIAPRYAGVVMGLSNTAGTLAGVVGVAATGMILSAASDNAGGAAVSGWTTVFATPALLCIGSAVVFIAFASGVRLFD